MKIRSCTEADVDDAAGLLAQMIVAMQDVGGHEASSEQARVAFYRQRVSQRLSLERCLFLVAEVDGDVAAVLEASIYIRDGVFLPADYLHIHGVFVSPGHRRVGIARGLMESALAWGEVRGCADVELHVLAKNPAVKLYESLGFEIASFTMTRSFS